MVLGSINYSANKVIIEQELKVIKNEFLANTITILDERNVKKG